MRKEIWQGASLVVRLALGSSNMRGGNQAHTLLEHGPCIWHEQASKHKLASKHVAMW